MNAKYLVAAGNLFLHSGRLVCRLPNRTIDVVAPTGLLTKLFSLLDGKTSVSNLIRQLSHEWDPGELRKILAEMEKLGVLVEDKFQPNALWEYVKNDTAPRAETNAEMASNVLRTSFEKSHASLPGKYHAPSETNFLSLLRERASIREFASTSVSTQEIVDLLWASYGVVRESVEQERTTIHHTVPSGGAIYPLSIHYVSLRETPEIAKGIYAVHFSANQKIGLIPIAHSANQIYRCFLRPDCLAGAQGVVVVSASFEQSGKKYGNRALLLSVLEAGHVAQNILLAATERDLAAVEIGGFVEDQLGPLLSLRKEIPLTTIIFGHPAEKSANSSLAPTIPFNWIDMNSAGYSLPVHLAEARFFDGLNEECSAWGRDTDAAMACTKAMAEFIERVSCEEPKHLFRASYSDIRNAVAPEMLVSYDAAQYRRRNFPFIPFSRDRDYWWGMGEEYDDGNRIAILGDFLFSSSSLIGRDQYGAYTSSTSSGVAAHTQVAQAIEGAALELVERDAFMRAWLFRKPAPTVVVRSLPADFQKRISNLKEIGVQVVIKDLSYRFASVIFLYAQDRKRGFTRVAAASSFDVEAALDRALLELEVLIQDAVTSDHVPNIHPMKIQNAEDHAVLYSNRKYFRAADFFLVTEKTRRLSDVGKGLPNNWIDFLAALRRDDKKLICINITNDERNPVFMAHLGEKRRVDVIRALIPGLLPISFGWGREPLGMIERPHQQKITRSKRKSGPLFPHPFA